MPEELVEAVRQLSEQSGHRFRISENVVPDTQLYVVWTDQHPFPSNYEPDHGVFGFRVPTNFPDAAPEDAFFIQPSTATLREADSVRGEKTIHRASATANYVTGTPLEGDNPLVFSWHIWNTKPWKRNTHTLIDHYQHCLRRFEQPEHD